MWNKTGRGLLTVPIQKYAALGPGSTHFIMGAHQSGLQRVQAPTEDDIVQQVEQVSIHLTLLL
jgi:hypothetical protein